MGDVSGSPRSKDDRGRGASCAGFAHPSEEEFARLLDFYRVRWRYEPRTFPLRWDEDGGVAEAFTPDFHLVDLGLYVELTTGESMLMAEKRRKVRRLRELYPDVRIKLLSRRDLKSLSARRGPREGRP